MVLPDIREIFNLIITEGEATDGVCASACSGVCIEEISFKILKILLLIVLPSTVLDRVHNSLPQNQDKGKSA